MKTTSKDVILDILRANPYRWLACHEIVDYARAERKKYMNECSVSARLRIDLKNQVEGRRREGKAYKEWRAVPEGCLYGI